VEGDIENGSVMAGQIAGAVTKIEPAAEIISDIITSADSEWRKLSSMFKN
ncbi:MAG: enoyl-[acyl-carrier-protein] reductase FabK, partial [Desulfitobacterium hafniense]|nr:enoyl-[acyl-carrier-protein] reductase FabK [Desulfitobacterium hafniense]